jgi:hypothetical protein
MADFIPFDPAAAFAGGAAVRDGLQQVQQRNALTAAMQQYGPGLMAGDPAALAAVAQFDPMAALDLQRSMKSEQRADKSLALQETQAKHGMAVDAERLEIARQAGQREAQTFAAKMDADQRQTAAEELKQIGSAASVAYQNGPDAWGQFMASYGDAMPAELRGLPHDQAPAAIAFATGVTEGLTGSDTQMTPYQQAQIDLEREKLKIGGRGQFGLTPIVGEDPNGEMVLMQPGSDGSVNVMQLPEGVKPKYGIDKVDAGDHWVYIDTRTAQTVGTEPKNLRNAAAETAIGKAQGEAVGTAQTGLSEAVSTADRFSGLIKSIVEDPSLGDITGSSWKEGYGGLMPDAMLGQKGVDLNTKLKQVAGQAFMEARDKLKGAGGLTDYEGQKGEEAIARLSRAQSKEAMQKALEELDWIINLGAERMRQRAAQGGAAVGNPAAPSFPGQVAAPPVDVDSIADRYR